MNKAEHVNYRITTKEKDALKKLAQRYDMTISKIIRRLIHKKLIEEGLVIQKIFN